MGTKKFLVKRLYDSVLIKDIYKIAEDSVLILTDTLIYKISKASQEKLNLFINIKQSTFINNLLVILSANGYLILVNISSLKILHAVKLSLETINLKFVFSEKDLVLIVYEMFLSSFVVYKINNEREIEYVSTLSSSQSDSSGLNVSASGSGVKKGISCVVIDGFRLVVTYYDTSKNKYCLILYEINTTFHSICKTYNPIVISNEYTVHCEVISNDGNNDRICIYTTNSLFVVYFNEIKLNLANVVHERNFGFLVGTDELICILNNGISSRMIGYTKSGSLVDVSNEITVKNIGKVDCLRLLEPGLIYYANYQQKEEFSFDLNYNSLKVPFFKEFYNESLPLCYPSNLYETETTSSGINKKIIICDKHPKLFEWKSGLGVNLLVESELPIEGVNGYFVLNSEYSVVSFVEGPFLLLKYSNDEGFVNVDLKFDDFNFNGFTVNFAMALDSFAVLVLNNCTLLLKLSDNQQVCHMLPIENIANCCPISHESLLLRLKDGSFHKCSISAPDKCLRLENIDLVMPMETTCMTSCFMFDSEMFAFCRFDGSIHLSNGKVIPNDVLVESLLFLSKNYLLTGLRNGSIMVYNVENGETVFESNIIGVLPVKIISHGEKIILCSNKTWLLQFNHYMPNSPKLTELLFDFDGLEESYLVFAGFFDDVLLGGINNSNVMILCEVQTRSCFSDSMIKHTEIGESVDHVFHLDTSRLICDNASKIVIYDWRSKKILSQSEPICENDEFIVKGKKYLFENLLILTSRRLLKFDINSMLIEQGTNTNGPNYFNESFDYNETFILVSNSSFVNSKTGLKRHRLILFEGVTLAFIVEKEVRFPIKEVKHHKDDLFIIGGFGDGISIVNVHDGEIVHVFSESNSNYFVNMALYGEILISFDYNCYIDIFSLEKSPRYLLNGFKVSTNEIISEAFCSSKGTIVLAGMTGTLYELVTLDSEQDFELLKTLYVESLLYYFENYRYYTNFHELAVKLQDLVLELTLLNSLSADEIKDIIKRKPEFGEFADVMKLITKI